MICVSSTYCKHIGKLVPCPLSPPFSVFFSLATYKPFTLSGNQPNLPRSLSPPRIHEVTVKNSTSKTIAALMIQMEAQECDGDDVHTQRASWVEYFQDGSFPLEGNNDYEGEILHALPAKMSRVSSDNLSYRLSVQLKFKGFPGGKIVTHLPLFIVDDEEWDRYQKEHQNGSRHNSEASEEKVAQKKKGKTNKKTKAKKKKSESEEEEEEEEDDSNSDNEKKKKKN